MRPLAHLAVALAVAGSFAQYEEEDERLREAEERDRRYMAEQEAARERLVAVDATDEELRAAFVELADGLVRDRHFAVAESDHFVVRTDDPRLDPKEVVTLFEEFVAFFEAFWTPSGALEPAGDPTPVYMLYSFSEYNQLLGGDFRFSPARPKGHYAPWLDAIAAHSDADSVGDLTDTMLHELTHQLAGKRLGIGHRSAPPWIVEGIATYFGFTYRDVGEGFVAGKIGDKNASFYREVGPRKPREPQARLAGVRRSFRAADRAEIDLVQKVLELEEPGAFYGMSSMSYNVSWIAFHYLMHGEEGAYRERFESFLRGEDRSHEALLERLELEADAFHRAVIGHARKMRVR